jgi:DNA processing protein
MTTREFKAFHAILALLMAEGATPSDCLKLREPPEEVFDQLQSEAGLSRLSDILGKEIGPVRWRQWETQLTRLERIRGEAFCMWDDLYPGYLRHIPQAPPILFYKGTLEGLYRRGVAIVGTRKPTAPGAALARTLGRELAKRGIPVVSGLARGIDSAAHRGSIEGGGGGIAVIGTGLDIPYPQENAGLLLDIAENGCAVTEQWLGSSAKAFVFPLRNRIISALSHAVVVVEAGGRSGALITAKWALEQGRDVGAVPGFPGDFRSLGTNRLLKQGAFVVESVADIVAAVPAALPVIPDDRRHAPEDEGRVSDDRNSDKKFDFFLDRSNEERLLHSINKSPVDPDELARHVELDTVTVQRLLLHLEMAGRIERDSLGRYTII